MNAGAAPLAPAAREPWRFFATVAYTGFAPAMPGTVAALLALALGHWLFALAWTLWLPLLVALTAASIPAVDRYLGPGRDLLDPREVVLDEFVGCLLALAFVPRGWPWEVAAFALFRLFDIAKPGPVRWLERLQGGAGVMLDDVAAGLLAGLLLFGAARILA